MTDNVDDDGGAQTSSGRYMSPWRTMLMPDDDGGAQISIGWSTSP